MAAIPKNRFSPGELRRRIRKDDDRTEWLESRAMFRTFAMDIDFGP
jgi:hypothetical protein